MKITPTQFFNQFFPNAYVCAKAEEGGQFEGNLFSPNKSPEQCRRKLGLYQELNKAQYNIFFTPNGGKTSEGKNRLDNINNVNAWWIDIDIEETRQANDEETKIRRESIKEEIRGFIFAGPKPYYQNLWPSLAVETRNGFQLYWFALQKTPNHKTQDGQTIDYEGPSVENWKTIGESIYTHFKGVGADHSTVKIMQLMRLPMFWYFKKGERGKIEIFHHLSTLKKHTEEEMQKFFPPIKMTIEEELAARPAQVYKPKYSAADGSVDFFKKVTDLPVDDVVAKLSGHWLVNHEVLKIQHMDRDKSNIMVNGKVSPNWVVRSRNHIYSNTSGTCTIIGYLEWYGWEYKQMKPGLRELFNL